MCILSKLHHAKFGVSNLFFFKSYRRKTSGGEVLLDPLLVQEGLRQPNFWCECDITLLFYPSFSQKLSQFLMKWVVICVNLLYEFTGLWIRRLATGYTFLLRPRNVHTINIP